MELAERVDECRELLDGRGPMVTGVSIGLLDRDETKVLVRGGCRPEGPPISASTVWEAASLSKPVVAMAALARADEIELSGPLALGPGDVGATPDERWDSLSLSHLLCHTSGLPNWRAPGQPLRFEADPGSAGYSGEGYELALAEMSARWGEPAEVLLADHLHALGMSSSSFTRTEADGADVAIGTDERGQQVPKSWPPAARASGSLHTTTGDYLTFLASQTPPDLQADLPLAIAARRMVTPAIDHAPGHGRTLGWASTATAAGAVLWQHGDNPGFKHVAAVRPATSEAMVVFTNSDVGQDFYRMVCRVLLDVEVW